MPPHGSNLDHDAGGAADRSTFPGSFGRMSVDEQLSVATRIWSDRDSLTKLSNCPGGFRMVLKVLALAVDLETDGEQIWEVGYARAGKGHLVDLRGGGSNLTMALVNVSARARKSPVVVGHNVIAWDWPIIARYIKSSETSLLWDTLLVQWMLTPGRRSLALSGSHHADADALDCLKLFHEQLDRLPEDVAQGVLEGRFESPSDLLAAMSESLVEAADYSAPPPSWLSSSDDGRILLVPEERLAELDWVQGVTIVNADDMVDLPRRHRQVDGRTLEELLAGRRNDAKAGALICVLRSADRQGIEVRRSMIPAWMTDHSSDLTGPLDQACSVAGLRQGRLQVAAMPKRGGWWSGASSQVCRIEGSSADALILDRGHGRWSDISKSMAPAPRAALAKISEEDGLSRWVVPDRAARLLDVSGGWTSFATLSIDPAFLSAFPADGKHVDRPLLGFSRKTSLHPNSVDQASYWMDMLHAFRDACASVGGTPILLVSSSASPMLIRMVETAMAELAMGEAKPERRSRAEHIKRTAERKLALVGHLNDWDTWRADAELHGVTLSPVLEALPLEEWFAVSSERSDDPEGPNDVRLEVAVSSLLDATPGLVREHLSKWLDARVIGTRGSRAVVLDTRLGPSARELSGSFDRLPLTDAPFTPDQKAALRTVFAPLSVVVQEAPSDFEAMERFFAEHWAPSPPAPGALPWGFKPSQKVAMEAIRDRSTNVLVRLPTGEGKSVLFQVPALCRGLRNRRLTLVLSPLRALMKDQVEDLRRYGFEESVDYMSGDRTPTENQEVLQGVLERRIVLLYVAPERLRSKSFMDVLERRMEADGGLEYVVLDEAHCLNQWGLEFRPDYFFATETLMKMCRPFSADDRCPFLFLSATITHLDRKQIVSMLPMLGDETERLPFAMRPEGFSQPVRSHIEILPRKMTGRVSARDFDATIQDRLPTILEAIERSQRNREETGQRSAVIIFVTSRRIAESLAELLEETTTASCDFFHARMDATRKQEVYAEFKEGDIDVLVATKAFGMGMDIPDIHWAIHLSPPSFVDDYLQEIGRIGRNVEKRELARLDKLEAVLPFSSEDFAHSRDMRMRNALRPQDTEDLLRSMRDSGHEADGHVMAMVPAIGYAPLEKGDEVERDAAINRTRMGIYWLERAGAVTLCESIADVIPVEMKPDLLKPLSQGKGPVAELSSFLMGMSGLESVPSRSGSRHRERPELLESSSTGSGSLLKRMLSSISDVVGFVLGRRSVPTPTTVSPSPDRSTPMPPLGSDEAEGVTAVVNLAQISAQSRTMKSSDDVLAALSDLQKSGAVDLKREIRFSRRKLCGEPEANIDTLFNLIDEASSLVIRSAAEGEVFLFQPVDLVDPQVFIQLARNEPPGETGRRSKAVREAALARRKEAFEKAFVNGFRSLVRSSGVRVRQIVTEGEKLSWEASIPHALRWQAEDRRKYLLAAGKAILAVVGRADEAVPLSDLIESIRRENPQRRFREDDLKKVAGILSAMRLVGMSVDLVEFSHLVMLNDVALTPDDEQGQGWRSDLIEVNEMADARILAMEIFASLRPEARDGFIDGYFACENSNQLKEFLETQLGEIAEEGGEEDGAASDVVVRMRERLRATKAVEFFGQFNVEDAEEPVQWEVMRHPYDQHLLVNAGPGAGKTAVLVGRIVHLIREQHIDPSKIVVLAFNRAVVSEIRTRVRTLFQSLGYAAYASRLRVSTVHSFAVKHLGREHERPRDAKMDDILKEFAARMSSDSGFQRQVAADLCCVLVDEFQDVTEDIYSIVHSLYLGSGSRAGVMVIGDDDQDILRWQRNGAFCEPFFDRFETDFGDRLTKKLLSVNFRSDVSIVSKSQEMISGFFGTRTRSRRLKHSLLSARREASGEDCVKRIDWNGGSMQEACSQIVSAWNEKGDPSGQSVAFLCRSNAEVAEVHRLLKPSIPGLSVQGIERLRVANMRHVAGWLDMLRMELSEGDAILSGKALTESMAEFRRSVDIPENAGHVGSLITLEELVELAFREQSSLRLSSLISFIEELSTDDVGRLRGAQLAEGRPVVSTIHKVKGLEYDHVFVLPSYTPFGLGRDIAGDAAEEARLLYVAMTRAKKSLMYFVGERERSWGRPEPRSFQGRSENGRILVGSAEDVGLGWSMMRIDRFNPDPDACQEYIEKHVKAGDRIVLGGQGAGAFKGFFHEGADGHRRQIGFLAKKHQVGAPHADLVVSSVIRFPPDEIDPDLHARCVVDRGWGYAVLVSGLLR